uniref:ribonuclease H n=1 Tax=Phasianus colchicus TaxID=9054 RepID=A0A669QJJ3_PHACC
MIYWSQKNIQRVMALVDTGAETSIVYRDPTKFDGDRVVIGGFGGQTTPVTQTWLKLGVGRLPPREYKVSIAPVQEYILGIDILWGLALQTTVGEFRLRQRCIGIWAVQAILRGHAKHGPICLPKPCWITDVGQYRLPGGQDEISRTVQELEKVGIIRPAHSPYNSPIWPVRKTDGTWRMTVDYRELNKVTPPIHIAVPNIASLMDTLSREIKTYHCVLDLANVFFSIPIAEESQDQFAFTWGGRQWTFQVLPQGYVHSPTYCHNLVVRDLADWKKPDDVNLYHYINDLLLTSNSLEAVGQVADSLITYLQQRGWAINPQKVQGPGLSVKFLGVVWSGKTKVLPSAVICKVQAFPVPTTSKQLQEFLGILGYWRSFIPHLVQLLRPLYRLTKKGQLWDWGKTEQDAFQQAKLAVKQAQALGIFDPTLPAELDVHVTQDGFGCDLWQCQSSVWTPIGFWSQVWHGEEERYSMIEKQLLAAYSALQAVEPITQTAEVIVKTTLPIQGWVKDLTHLPKTGVAQAQTVARWVAYLSQRSSLSSSPLKEELQKIPGPVTYHCDAPKETLVAPPEKSPVQEGKYPIPEDAWCTDGSSKGNPSKWRAIAYHPSTKTIWFDEGDGQSSQWAELRAVWMVIPKEPGDGILNTCTDSWAVYRGLTLWIAQWATQEWTIHARPIWGKDMWLDIWNTVKHRTMCVYHVSGHQPLQSPGNDEADTLAQVRWIENSPSENIAHWLHQKLRHEGQKTMWAAAKAWGLPIQLPDIVQACRHCDTCSKMRPRSLLETTARLARGHNPLQRWQIDYIGPLPRSEGARYALTCVDTASGLLQAYPVLKANQAYTIKALTKLMSAYGTPQVIESNQGTHFTGATIRRGQKKTTSNGNSTCHIIQRGQASLNVIMVFLRLP